MRRPRIVNRCLRRPWISKKDPAGVGEFEELGVLEVSYQL
jgi:hypothetical protein